MKLLLIIMTISFTMGDDMKKINLEDIERDNLISEHHAQSKDELESQQTQHLQPPSILAPTSYEINHGSSGQQTNQAGDNLQNQAKSTYSLNQNHGQYDTSQNHGQYDTSQNHDQYVNTQQEHQQQQQDVGKVNYQQQIEYTQTPHQSYFSSNEPPRTHLDEEKEYQQIFQYAPSSHAYTPVHEEGQTSAAPSRHSLITPIMPTASVTPSPYLAQQPQYVYVPANPSNAIPHQYSKLTYNQIQPESNEQNNVQHYDANLKYTTLNTSPIAYEQAQPLNAVSYAQAIPTLSHNYHQQHPPAQTYQPNSQHFSQSPPQYIQYVQYVAEQTPHQPYIMMIPLKAQQNYLKHSAQPQYEYASQPIQYTQSVTVPQNSIDYTVPSAQYLTAPKPVHYTNPQNYQQPSHVQIQQSIEYPSQRIVEYSQPHTHNKYSPLPQSQLLSTSINHKDNNHNLYGLPQTLDFFGTHTHNKHTSLLDSYIPSSVILERQKAFYNGRQQTSLPSTNILTNAASHSSSGNSLYNTIAYSAPLKYHDSNHLKRSPKTTKLEKSN